VSMQSMAKVLASYLFGTSDEFRSMLHFPLAPFSKVHDLLMCVFLRSNGHDLLRLFGLREFWFHHSRFPPECSSPGVHRFLSCVLPGSNGPDLFSLSLFGTSGEFWSTTSPRHSSRVSNFWISRSVNTCPLQLNGHDELWLFGLQEFFLPLCDFPLSVLSSRSIRSVDTCPSRRTT
jgi:hypothetical protein